MLCKCVLEWMGLLINHGIDVGQKLNKVLGGMEQRIKRRETRICFDPLVSLVSSHHWQQTRHHSEGTIYDLCTYLAWYSNTMGPLFFLPNKTGQACRYGVLSTFTH